MISRLRFNSGLPGGPHPGARIATFERRLESSRPTFSQLPLVSKEPSVNRLPPIASVAERQKVGPKPRKPGVEHGKDSPNPIWSGGFVT